MIKAGYKNAINIVSFNAIWALAILKGNAAIPWMTLLIALHFVIVGARLNELKVVVSAALIGYSIDCTLTLIGFFSFEQVQGVTPLWLVFLWLGFCTTLQHSLLFFFPRVWLSALFGGVCGGFTYLLAARFGAVQLVYGELISFLLIATVWSLLFPGLMRVVGFFRRSLCLQN